MGDAAMHVLAAPCEQNNSFSVNADEHGYLHSLQAINSKVELKPAL
jgi:hypothetical protein